MTPRAAVVHRCQAVKRVHVGPGRYITRPCGAPATERHVYHSGKGCTQRDYCDADKGVGDLHLSILADSIEKFPVAGK